jgi:hypothetical protein
LAVLTGLKWLKIGNIRHDDCQQLRVSLPSNLQRLDMQNKQLRNVGYQSCKHLASLELGVAVMPGVFGPADFTPLDSKWLASLKELRELKLIDPMERHVRAIAALTSLRGLSLQTVEYAGVEDTGMRLLAGLSQLESLTVKDWCGGEVGNRPIDEGLDVLGKLPNLRRLALSGFRKVTPKGLENVWRLTQLRALRLDFFPESAALIDDKALDHISAMVELEELSIGETSGMVTDRGIKGLASLKKLRRLNLSRIAGYSDDALGSLMKALPNLHEVNTVYIAPPIQKQK